MRHEDTCSHCPRHTADQQSDTRQCERSDGKCVLSASRFDLCERCAEPSCMGWRAQRDLRSGPDLQAISNPLFRWAHIDMHTNTMTSKPKRPNATLAAAFAGLLLFSPHAFANEVQIFPPQTITGSACPQGDANGLLWDGIHNVECVYVPTCSAALGQGLTFDGTKFSCVTPCVPQPTAINSGTCPPGEIGSPVSQPAVLNCDGTITLTGAAPTNTCQVWVAASSMVPCSPGQTLTGYLDTTGAYHGACGGINPPCVNYTCTASGLVPQ